MWRDFSFLNIYASEQKHRRRNETTPLRAYSRALSAGTANIISQNRHDTLFRKRGKILFCGYGRCRHKNHALRPCRSKNTRTFVSRRARSHNIVEHYDRAIFTDAAFVHAIRSAHVFKTFLCVHALLRSGFARFPHDFFVTGYAENFARTTKQFRGGIIPPFPAFYAFFFPVRYAGEKHVLFAQTFVLKFPLRQRRKRVRKKSCQVSIPVFQAIDQRGGDSIVRVSGNRRGKRRHVCFTFKTHAFARGVPAALRAAV